MQGGEGEREDPTQASCCHHRAKGGAPESLCRSWDGSGSLSPHQSHCLMPDPPRWQGRASAPVTGELTSVCGTQSCHHDSKHMCTFTVGLLPRQCPEGPKRISGHPICLLLEQPYTVKSQISTLSLMHGCEPHGSVICLKKGFYFPSRERSPLKKVQLMLEGKRLSTGIHLLHFTSCTLLNPEAEARMHV